MLPKNTEIEAALAAHHRLFEAHTHSSTLSSLRRTALQAMRLLQRFEPRLVGPVLSGTASAHSEVNLHLFAEGAEPVALHLMEKGVPHRMGERRLRYEPNRLVATRRQDATTLRTRRHPAIAGEPRGWATDETSRRGGNRSDVGRVGLTSYLLLIST